MYIGKKPPRFTERSPHSFAGDLVPDQSRISPPFAQVANLDDFTPVPSPFLGDWPDPAVGESAHFGYNLTSPVVHKEDDDVPVFTPELGLSPGKMEIAIALGLNALQLPIEY